MSTWLARLWPLALWGVTVALMAHNWQIDPFDPALEGTARYGHNHEGALAELVLWTAVELVVLYVVLAPGAARPGSWRALTALLLFTPWTLLSLLFMMHAGGVVALHGLWLMVVDAAIVVVLVSRVARRRESGAASA